VSTTRPFESPVLHLGPGFRRGLVSGRTCVWAIRRGTHLFFGDLKLDVLRRIPVRASVTCELAWSPRDNVLYFSHGDLARIDATSGMRTRICSAEEMVAGLGIPVTVPTPGDPMFGYVLRCDEIRDELIGIIQAGNQMAFVWLSIGGVLRDHILIPFQRPGMDVLVSRSLCFAPISSTGSAQIWYRSGALVASLDGAVIDPRLVGSGILSGSFNPFGGRIAIGARQGLAVWDYERNSVEWLDVGAPCTPTWSPDGGMIAYVYGGSEFRIAVATEGGWNTSVVASMGDETAGRAFIQRPTFSPDGSIIWASLDVPGQRWDGTPCVSPFQFVINWPERRLAPVDDFVQGTVWVGDSNLPLIPELRT